MNKNKKSEDEEAGGQDGELHADNEAQSASQPSKSRLRFWRRSGDEDKGKDKHQEQDAATDGKKAKGGNKGNNSTLEIPQTFEEMCNLNASMVGANITFVKIVQECFENIVAATIKGDDTRLELEANLMALRLHKEVKGEFALKDFKLCMLASLRSRLPKSWSIAHEHAWSHMWDTVSHMLTKSMSL